MVRKQREILAQRRAGVPRVRRARPDRDFHHAVLSSHPSAAVRFQHRLRLASAACRCPAASSYPGDARHQLQTAREFIEREFGRAPVGLWPSEGSVSDDALALAAEAGFEWAASDNGVLAQTLHKTAGPDATYRSYLWSQQGRQMRMIFRDHFLSDQVGFVYSKMGASEAAVQFLERIRANAQPVAAGGGDVLVPIILDGENAWEYYYQNGRPFLSELYRRIEQALRPGCR